MTKLTSLAEKAKLNYNYYKLILGQEYHLLPRVIEEQKKFINDQILQLNSTTNYDIETKVLKIISLAINIHKIFKFNERDALENYIVETLEQNKNFSDQFLNKLSIFCLDLMRENYTQENFSKSIKYAEIFEKDLSKIKSFPQEIQLIIFDILGDVYANSDPSKALNYLSEAELLKPNNNNIIEIKYNIYLKLYNLDAAIIEAEKIIDNDIKALFKINAYSKFLSIQDITGFNDLLLQYGFNKLPFDKFKNDPLNSYMYYDIQAQQNINSGQYQAACKIYDKLLNQAATANHNVQFFNVMYSYLLLFLRQEDWNNGCKFLDKIYNQYPSILVNYDDWKLKDLELIFYNSNDQYLNKSDKILADIKPAVLIDKEWVECIVYAYNSKLYQANSNQKVKEKLPIYIKNIEKLYNDSLNNSEIPDEAREYLLYLIKEGKCLQAILSSNEAPIDSTPQETEIIETQEEQPTASPHK